METPIGEIYAASIGDKICLLDFVDSKEYEPIFNKLRQEFNAEMEYKTSPTLEQLRTELEEYFEGKRKDFQVETIQSGTPFQEKVWKILENIPYGTTISYKEEALQMGNIKASRAVANANGRNKISILVPCHRVVASNGKLGGYGGGLDRKIKLLELEAEYRNID